MTTIAVAISGGVDSLVAAFLLKKDGHDVFGIHFRTGYESVSPDRSVTTAMPPDITPIAGQLDMPVDILDLSKTFQDTVVTYFASTYQEGRTPNPCLFCNPVIKFGHVLSHAHQKGAQALATGHYARVQTGPDQRRHLYRGVDCAKDQSYFLARLTQDQLASARFPLGGLTKKKVRAIARKHDLVPTTRRESQDICFIKNGSYHTFLQNQDGFQAQPGVIEDTGGRELGNHQGLHLFTVGQRRGINCPAAEPYYVIRLDHRQNRLVVGKKSELPRRSATVAHINWINRPEGFPADVNVQIRYRHDSAPAVIRETSPNSVELRFRQPQASITPGQGAVFYQGDECLGGGWIV